MKGKNFSRINKLLSVKANLTKFFAPEKTILNSASLEKTFWEIYAQFYDSTKILIPYQMMMKRILSLLKRKGQLTSVLDAGCGTGNLGYFMSQNCNTSKISINAIDNSPAMLKVAERKLNKTKLNIVFQKADLNHDLPYEDEKFDIILCINTLYATQDPQKIIDSFWSKLSKNGQLIIVTPHNRASLKKIFQKHFYLISQIKGVDKIKIIAKSILYTPKFIASLLLNALIIKVKAQKRIYHFFDLPDLKKLVENSGFCITLTETIYADTDILICAQKTAKNGRLSVEVVKKNNFIFDKIASIRYNVYCTELNSLNPKNYPNKKEIDEYDSNAIFFVLKKDREVIGMLRLVLPINGLFLMERYFTIPQEIDKNKIIEPSRTIIIKTKRGKNLSALLDEVARIWSLENGYSMWCLAMSTEIYQKRKGEGWNMIKLGGETNYHNTKSIPAIRIL